MYDLYLLILTSENLDFACIGIQTDDILGLSTTVFAQREEDQRKKANFTAKAKELLTLSTPLTFNRGTITILDYTITLC